MLLDIRWYSGETACASALSSHRQCVSLYLISIIIVQGPSCLRPFKTFMFKILLSSNPKLTSIQESKSVLTPIFPMSDFC